MARLPLVGLMNLQVSFAKEPYKRDNTLETRPIILSILLTVATPYSTASPAHFTQHTQITKQTSMALWFLIGSWKVHVDLCNVCGNWDTFGYQTWISVGWTFGYQTFGHISISFGYANVSEFPMKNIWISNIWTHFDIIWKSKCVWVSYEKYLDIKHLDTFRYHLDMQMCLSFLCKTFGYQTFGHISISFGNPNVSEFPMENIWISNVWIRLDTHLDIKQIPTSLSSWKLQVSLVKEPCKRDYTLQKRPMISRSLLIDIKEIPTSLSSCMGCLRCVGSLKL